MLTLRENKVQCIMALKFFFFCFLIFIVSLYSFWEFTALLIFFCSLDTQTKDGGCNVIMYCTQFKTFYSFCKEPCSHGCVSLCGPDLEVCSIGPKHVTVKRFAHFIYWRLPPASGVITKRTVLQGGGTRGWRDQRNIKHAEIQIIFGVLNKGPHCKHEANGKRLINWIIIKLVNKNKFCSLRSWLTSGMGELSPGILRLG